MTAPDQGNRMSELRQRIASYYLHLGDDRPLNDINAMHITLEEAERLISQEAAKARIDELKLLDRNDDDHILLTDAGLRYFMARLDALQGGTKG